MGVAADFGAHICFSVRQYSRWYTRYIDLGWIGTMFFDYKRLSVNIVSSIHNQCKAACSWGVF